MRLKEIIHIFIEDKLIECIIISELKINIYLISLQKNFLS